MRSFLGQEDLDLEAKLSTELPGILNSAIRHLQRLLKRGYFIQPESGKVVAQRMKALSSPISEFIKLLPPSPFGTKGVIWGKWKLYCEGDNGRRKVGTQEELWANLESAGYTCDFEAADILAKIRRDGSQQKRDLRDCARKFHDDATLLDTKLAEMVKSGLLEARTKVAANGQPVKVYSLNSPQFQVDEIPASTLPTSDNEGGQCANGGDGDKKNSKSAAEGLSENPDVECCYALTHMTHQAAQTVAKYLHYVPGKRRWVAMMTEAEARAVEKHLGCALTKVPPIPNFAGRVKCQP
jgi:hypothetical protein